MPIAGSVSTKYYRRIRATRPVTRQLREAVRDVLVEALRKATIEELYNRTPLPVTHRMLNSIGGYINGDMVLVGYNVALSCVYAGIRVNKKGRSRMGGHIMDMKPAPLIHKYADSQIRSLTRRAQRLMLEV